MTRHPALKNRSSLRLIATGLVAAVVILAGARVDALTSNRSIENSKPVNVGGIIVSPARVDMTLGDPGSIQSQLLTVVNNYNVAVHMSAQFSGINESAGLLVPLGEPDENLSPALAISETDITLAPHAAHQLTVQVTNEAHLSPGGHYATLLLTPDIALPAGQTDMPTGQLPIRASLSVNLFIIKSQGAQIHLGLESLSTNQWLFKLPTEAKLGFVNQGNVHGVPRATVMVLSTDSKQALAKGIANQASLPLLPGKHLIAVTPMSSLARTWKPQKVTLQARYRFDGSDDVQNYSRAFWYIPPIWLTVLIVPIAIIGWVLGRPLGVLIMVLRVLWLLLAYSSWSFIRSLFAKLFKRSPKKSFGRLHKTFLAAVRSLKTLLQTWLHKAVTGLRNSRHRRRASKRLKSLKRQATPPSRPSGRPYGIMTAGKPANVTKKVKKAKEPKRAKMSKKMNTPKDIEV